MPRTLLGAVLALVLLLIAGPPAYALERRSGDVITVPAGETVEDDLAVSSRVVRIDGMVRGDVYAFAQEVTVAGVVEGDLIAMAQDVVIDGKVLGDVRAAGATVRVNGTVERNVTGAGQVVRVSEGGRVGGSVMGAAERLWVSGDVGGAVAGVGENVLVQGRIGRRADLAFERFTFDPTARVGGDLVLKVPSDAPAPQISPSAVGGRIALERIQKPQRVERSHVNRFLGAVVNFFSLTWLVGSAVVGLVMLRAFPRFVARFLDALERSAARSFGIGVLALVATLPLALLMAITIVGLPAAAILLGGWVSGMFIGWLLLAVAVGGVLIGLVRRGAPRRLSWSFLVGLLVLYVATRVPFLGPLVGGLGLSLGLGALVIALHGTWRRAELGVGAA